MNSLIKLMGFGAFLLLTTACETSSSGCTDSAATNFNIDATTDDGSCTYGFPAGYAKANYTELLHKVYGGPGNNDDELTSGMIMDAAGNAYFSINTNDAAANNNILVGRINADGTLAWAKEWDGNYDDVSPDSGENGETGGTANSISMDASGNIYVVGETADGSTNNVFSLLVLKINPTNGSIVWQKTWKHNWPNPSLIASMDASGYAVDASKDYVYVTGSNGENKIPLIALDKSTGNLFFEMTIDIATGTKDIGNSVKADGNGNVFIGGISGSNPFLAKVTGANTATPALAWTKKIDIGFSSRFNSMDIDGTDVYLSCDRRGAITYFSIIKVDANGSLVWGKTFPASGGDRTNTHCVKVVGNSVYAGGRIGADDLDEQNGDGLLVKMAKADGALEWSAIYFTGLGSTVGAEHRVKSIAVSGNDVYVAGQVYSGNNNTDHFYGDWITKSVQLETYSPSITNLTQSVTTDPANGEIRTAVGTFSNAKSQYLLQDAVDKNNATPPDGDFFFMKMNLQ